MGNQVLLSGVGLNILLEVLHRTVLLSYETGLGHNSLYGHSQLLWIKF